jgi:hypothetical protein
MALKSMKHADDSWGVSVYTARRLAAAGVVHTVKVGRRRLIAESEIERVELTCVSDLGQLRFTKSLGQRAVTVKASGKR